jgi:hypothetical protein
MRGLFALVALAACEREPAPGVASSGTASAAPPAPVRLPLAAPAAFDIARTRRGAAVAWGPPEGGLRVAWLDPTGARGAVRGGGTRAEERLRIVEIAAASTGESLGLAWLAREGAGTVVLGAVATERGIEPAARLDAGAEAGARRGAVAVAAQGSRLVAFHRAAGERCAGAVEARCAPFRFRVLAPSGATRGRPELAVPSPCDRGIAGLALTPSHWHYAVCAQQGPESATTVFTAQPEPPYAQAERVLAGCAPHGMTLLEDGTVIVVAGCAGGRRAVRLRGVEPATPLDLATLEITCDAATPVVRAPGFEVPIDSVVDRAEPVLPAGLAPDGTRAVWAGESLLVARPVADELELAAYACRAGVLTRRR